MPFGTCLRKVQHSRHDIAHVLQLVLLQIVLRDAHICLDNLTTRSILPRRQAHVLLLRTGTLHDQLSSRVLVHRVMHLVLYHLEELPRHRCILVVVHAGGIDVRQLLVETTLGETNLMDLSQQVFEVILAQEGSVLHAFPVEHIAFDGKLPQDTGCPSAELGGTNRINTIPHGDDGIEVVEINFLSHLPSNASIHDCCKFCNCHLRTQFTGLIYVRKVTTNA